MSILIAAMGVALAEPPTLEARGRIVALTSVRVDAKVRAPRGGGVDNSAPTVSMRLTQRFARSRRLGRKGGVYRLPVGDDDVVDLVTLHCGEVRADFALPPVEEDDATGQRFVDLTVGRCRDPLEATVTLSTETEVTDGVATLTWPVDQGDAVREMVVRFTPEAGSAPRSDTHEIERRERNDGGFDVIVGSGEPADLRLTWDVPAPSPRPQDGSLHAIVGAATGGPKGGRAVGQYPLEGSGGPARPSRFELSHTSPEGLVRLGVPIILGRLDGATLNAKASLVLGEIEACYAPRLEADPQLTGKLVVRITIGEDGTVSQARVRTGTLQDDALRQCVLEPFGKLRFDPPAEGLMIANLPLLFAPEIPPDEVGPGPSPSPPDPDGP